MNRTRSRIAALLACTVLMLTAVIANGRAADASSTAQLFHTHELAMEPTIAVDLEGRVFYQTYDLTGVSAVLVSTDRGSSWARVPGNAGGDPRVTVDSRTGRLFNAGDFKLRYSDDGGQSWSTDVLFPMAHGEYEMVAVGPPPQGGSAPSGYPNVVYWCAQSNEDNELTFVLTTANEVRCAASLDGGQTFGPFGDRALHFEVIDALALHCATVYGRPRVGPNGWLYLPSARCVEDPAGSGQYVGYPTVFVSRDEARTWQTLTVPGHTTRTFEIVPGTPTPDGHVAVAVTEDRLVVGWIDHEDKMPWLAISRDGGATWSADRVPLPAGAGLVDTAQPVIAFAGDKLALAYVGGDAAGNWNGYVTVTSDMSATTPALTTYEVPDGPLWTNGGCETFMCGTNGEFMDAAMDADGTVYVALVTGCGPDATNGGVGCTNLAWQGEGVVARMQV